MGGYDVHIRYKNIKNLYLRVQPPGVVEVSAPQGMTGAAIEGFISRRRTWIDERLRLICASAAAEKRRRYETGEMILLWGVQCPLEVRPVTRGKAYAEYADGRILLYASPDADVEERAEAVRALYRAELAAAIERTVPECEHIVGKHAAAWRIRAMKTRWGSCSTRTASITLNLALARYERRGCADTAPSSTRAWIVTSRIGVTCAACSTHRRERTRRGGEHRCVDEYRSSKMRGNRILDEKIFHAGNFVE